MCKKENTPFPEIDFNENYFYVTFRQSEEYRKIMETQEEDKSDLNERQREALRELKKSGSLTMKRYIELCPEVSRRTLTRDINHLIDLRLIVRKGKGKRDMYYELSE